ncbi:BnaAnng07580D [Brassica napus]|uniref:BnaAnng07580D protein n=1 Tax=Brassica napus TaxID=3708 RepID=A0A078I3P6_BRANA|nr:BnaAnng07580D [Brassica napus]
MSSRHDKEKGVNVQVLLRCRPFSDDELRSNAPQVLTCNDLQREVAVSQNIAGKHTDRVFTFDKVFGPSAKQKELYDQAVVPIVNEVLEGFNCTIFAYGQTGTGKTYTMEGECRRSKGGHSGGLPAEAGVIPRAVKQIFDTLEGQEAEYSVKVTFLELYNEEITDLLAPEDISRVASEDKQKKPLPLMEDGKGGVLVRGLEEEIVTSANEIFTLLERGSSKRRTAETFLNKQSSRSHSLFSITIHIKEATPEGEELIKLVSHSSTETKTCIIATVSPAVHCLEETLSTLDYAHRAKHIRNKPEVNQKMMKSTLIKDLYGEIERLKAEVYASREKNGVYMPKERYYQEESERKAMAEQIEQMGGQIENYQKKLEELQDKYTGQVRECSDLTSRLDSTEKSLSQTSKMLASTDEELKKSQYAMKEKDFIISEQKKSENVLVQQACVLQSNLEKATKENESLHQKIGKENKLSADNRKVVDNYQAELSEQISNLFSMVASCLSQQNAQLHGVNKLSQSRLEAHNKAILEMKKKVGASRDLYSSHLEAVQNVVRLHKANSNACLEEVSALTTSSASSIDEFLASGEETTSSLFDELQNALTSHQREMALFARELRQKFHTTMEQTQEMSEYTSTFFQKLMQESKNAENRAAEANDNQINSIIDFQKTYEAQSKYDTEKLIADLTNLVSCHVRRQHELVDSRLSNFKDAVSSNKTFLDEHVSTVNTLAKDAKRKWETFSMQAENDAREGADFSAAKHCQMELLLQQSVGHAESAFKHCKLTHESLKEMNSKQVADVSSLVKSACDNNEQHDGEVESARTAAEEDVTKNSDEIIQQIDGMSEDEKVFVSQILENVKTHEKSLESFQHDHCCQARCIEDKAQETFQQRYMEYEPTGTTPSKSEPDVPTKDTIESLRAMPVETLVEVFRENNSYESFAAKESKPQQLTRSPLSQVN